MKTLDEIGPPKPEEREQSLCWMEVLRAAFDGLYPTDQSLEDLLDHIEGTP
ncbi:MAG: hypothetical protein AAFY59_09440 [Pseudomonadota bacterium]